MCVHLDAYECLPLKVTPKSMTHAERIQKKKEKEIAEETARLTSAIRKNQGLEPSDAPAVNKGFGSSAPASLGGRYPAAWPSTSNAPGTPGTASTQSKNSSSVTGPAGFGPANGQKLRSAEVESEVRAQQPLPQGSEHTAASPSTQLPSSSAADRSKQSSTRAVAHLAERQRIEGSGSGTAGVCWHRGRVLSGGGDGKVRAWEVETGKMLSEAKGHGGRQVTSMWVFGERMVTGGVDGTVMVWNVGGGVVEEVRRFNALEKARAGAGQRHGVTSVCGHGSRVYSGVAGEGEGAGNDVLVWDVDGNKYVNKMAGHRSWVTGMGILMGGKFLATVSLDCTIRIWSIESMSVTFFSGANRVPGQVAVDPTGLLGVGVLPVVQGEGGKGKQGLVTISEGGQVDLWEVTTETGMVEVKHVEGARHGEGELESGCVGVLGGWMEGGESRWRVVSGGSEGRVKVWGVGGRGGWEETESCLVAEGKYPIDCCRGEESEGRVVVGLGEREEGGRVEASVRVLGWSAGS